MFAVARRSNITETINISISTTPSVLELIEIIVQMGFHGRNVAEAAELLMKERVLQLMEGDDNVAEALKHERNRQTALARWGAAQEGAN
jgi:hypothetical protein